MKLIIDKEFENLIPPLTAEEYEQLEENVKKEGCRDGIVVWGETIIDGHNRFKICTNNKIEFKVIRKGLKNREEAIEWIIRNQFGRRNLPSYERAKLALRLKPIIAERAKENQGGFKGNQYKSGVHQKSDKDQIETTKEIAKIAGVSHDTIHKVEVIEKEGSEEVKEQLGKREISVNKAYGEVRKGKTKVCSICGIEKPIDEFYKGKSKCKICHNQIRTHSIKDIKGNIIRSNDKVDELAKKHMSNIAETLYTDKKDLILTPDDMTEDLESFSDTFVRNATRITKEYNLEVTKENNKKIIAVLSEVEQAIKKIRECFLYE